MDAARTAVCGSVHGGVLAVRFAVFGAALGSVWQCGSAAVRQCVCGSAAVCGSAVVCGSAQFRTTRDKKLGESVFFLFFIVFYMNLCEFIWILMDL
jgi:hypothetical protein